MKILLPILLLILSANASQSGGTHLSLEKVLKNEKLQAVIITVTGYEKQIVTKVTKGVPPRGRNEKVYDSTSFRKVTLTGTDQNGKKVNFYYIEPDLNYTFKLDKNGEEQSILHSLGFIYTGSGIEFTEKACKPKSKLIILVSKENPAVFFRAEIYSAEMLKKIKKSLP